MKTVSERKNKIEAAACTVIVHLSVVALLFLLAMNAPPVSEESGVEVMMGNNLLSAGNDYTMTEVDVMKPMQKVEPESEHLPDLMEEAVITQEEEKTVEMTPEESAEKERREEEQREAEERAKVDRMAQTASDLFKRGSKSKSSGTETEEAGVQGSPQGNSVAGESAGGGGTGRWDLSGRSLGPDGLPVPAYNVQDEGRVVVTITVNPAGRVIATSIHSRTNTVNPALRRAALEAAARAQFNSVELVDNQMGTITYYFKLK